MNRFGTDEYRADTLKALNEVDHKIVIGNEAVIDSVDRIEKLLTNTPPVVTSAAIKQRVTDRAIAGLAPYHRSKNSVGDAILIETYGEATGRRTGKNTRFGFVTHNSKDFSEPNGDRRKPHPDIGALFTPPKSTYWGSLVDVIKEIDPVLLDDHDSEFNYSQQPRRLSEILEAKHLLFRQVWYNRHWNLRSEVESGNTNCCPKRSIPVIPTSRMKRSMRFGRARWRRQRRPKMKFVWKTSVRGTISNGACSMASCPPCAGFWETNGTCSIRSINARPDFMGRASYGRNRLAITSSPSASASAPAFRSRSKSWRDLQAASAWPSG